MSRTKGKSNADLTVIESYGGYNLAVDQHKNQRWQWYIRESEVPKAFGPLTGEVEKNDTIAAGRVFFDALRKSKKVENAEALVNRVKDEFESTSNQLTTTSKALDRERSVTAGLSKELGRARLQRNIVAVLTVISIAAAAIAIAPST